MQYFTMEELTRSATAEARGIDNTPTDKVKENLEALVDHVLDPLRRAWGKPLTVTSGYRCAALNKAVGGVKNSQHLSGHAADITAGSPQKNKRLFRLIQQLGLPFDQLIDERNYRWVHVSFDPTRSRRQVLRL